MGQSLSPRRLGDDFYGQDVLVVAPGLLGKILCRATPDGVLRARVCEVEAYRGEADTACHARAGRTSRTQVMYLAGGHAYVYLCYGIHHMLNVVAAEEGNPQAALIRGVQPLDPQREPIVGPGRLTREYGITMAENRLDLRVSDTLWFEDDEYAPPRIETGPRIGIGYASAEDQARPWRYVARL